MYFYSMICPYCGLEHPSCIKSCYQCGSTLFAHIVKVNGLEDLQFFTI